MEKMIKRRVLVLRNQNYMPITNRVGSKRGSGRKMLSLYNEAGKVKKEGGRDRGKAGVHRRS